MTNSELDPLYNDSSPTKGCPSWLCVLPRLRRRRRPKDQVRPLSEVKEDEALVQVCQMSSSGRCYQLEEQRRKGTPPPGGEETHAIRVHEEVLIDVGTSSSSQALPEGGPGVCDARDEATDSCTAQTPRAWFWSKSLENLILDPIGVKVFMAFLVREMSEENLKFWLECEEFRKTTDMNQMQDRALRMFNLYMVSNATDCVNIDQRARDHVLSKLGAPDRDMFARAQEQVFRNMKYDSYKRFLQSLLYKNCLKTDLEKTSMENLCLQSNKVMISRSSRGSFDSIPVKLQGPVQSPFKDMLRRSSTKTSLGNERSRLLAKKLSSPTSITSKASLTSDSLSTFSSESHDLVVGSGGDSVTARITYRGETTQISCLESASVQQVLERFCEQRELRLTQFEVLTGLGQKMGDLDQRMGSLESRDLLLQRTFQCRLDLPNGRSVGISSEPNVSLIAAIEPILTKHGLHTSELIVHLASIMTPLDLKMTMSSFENKHIVASTLTQWREMTSRIGKKNSKYSSGSTSTPQTRSRLKGTTKGSSGDLTIQNSPKEAPTDLLDLVCKLQEMRINDQRGLINRQNVPQMPFYLGPKTSGGSNILRFADVLVIPTVTSVTTPLCSKQGPHKSPAHSTAPNTDVDPERDSLSKNLRLSTPLTADDSNLGKHLSSIRDGTAGIGSYLGIETSGPSRETYTADSSLV